jgi:hypothetical protein
MASNKRLRVEVGYFLPPDPQRRCGPCRIAPVCQMEHVVLEAMTHPLYGPWTVAAYMPLGAIVFLHRRWKMKITGESIPPPVIAAE